MTTALWISAGILAVIVAAGWLIPESWWDTLDGLGDGQGEPEAPPASDSIKRYPWEKN